MTPGPAAGLAPRRGRPWGSGARGWAVAELEGFVQGVLMGSPCTALQLFTAVDGREMFICTLWPYFEHINEKKLIFAGFSLCTPFCILCLLVSQSIGGDENIMEVAVCEDPEHLCRWEGGRGDYVFPSRDLPTPLPGLAPAGGRRGAGRRAEKEQGRFSSPQLPGS